MTFNSLFEMRLGGGVYPVIRNMRNCFQFSIRDARNILRYAPSGICGFFQFSI